MAAERELRIRVTADTSEADQVLDAFWRREMQREAQAGGQGAGGGAAAAGRAQGMGGGGGVNWGGGGAAPQQVAQAGALPGNIPNNVALPGPAGGGAQLGGGLPGMIPMVVPGAAAPPPALGGGMPGMGGGGMAALPPAAMGGLPGMGGGQLGLPGPAGGPALVPSGPAWPGGWQPMAPAGGAGGGAGGPGTGLAPSGGIPAQARVIPRGRSGGGGGGGGGQAGVAAGMMAATGLQAASEGVQVAAQSQADANDQVRGLIPEMEREREANREIAALRGLPNTAATAAMLQREAAETGLSGDQWRDFQTGFQAYAGQYVGTGPDSRITPEQATRLQQRVASFGVGSRGWSGADASRLLGTVISKAKPGASDEDILGQYSQMAQVMQLAPGYTGPLLGQLAEVVAEGVGPNGDFNDSLDAAVLLRGISERNPRTASAYTRAVLRGLREARMDPKEKAALGLQDGMDIFQQIEAVGRAQDAHVAAGGNADEFLMQHGFAEIRQFGGLGTALNSGLRGGGFARARAEAGDRAAMAGALEFEAGNYVMGQEGQSQGDRARIAAARRERAGAYAPLEHFRRLAELSYESSGAAEQGEGFGGILTRMGGLWGQGDRKEQEVRAETARLIRQGLMGYQAGRDYLHAQVPAMAGPGTQERDQQLRNGRMASDELLGQCARELMKLRQLAEQQARVIDAARSPVGQVMLGAVGIPMTMPAPSTRY